VPTSESSEPTKAEETSSRSEVSVDIIPELPAISINGNPSFHTQLSLKYLEGEEIAGKMPLDVVCILDNSGSMDGSKIMSLKNAMNFVVGCLTPLDRLSVVSFNSHATPLHGLLRMNPANKERARKHIEDIVAGGGTDIYAGMNTGWSICKARRTFNPSTCVFLLTDGQDGSRFEEKKTLAREIKASGASLFVFGFGSDHDSAHMTAIANAAEGSFIYIETDDTVIDAFGGTIGTQQGQSLKNISLRITSASPGLIITQAVAGNYTVMTEGDGRSSVVSFANLYRGEFRDVLVQLSVPAVSGSVESYPLVTASVTYNSLTEVGSLTVSPEFTGSVKRCSDEELSALPPAELAANLSVDAQINRKAVTEAISEAMKRADEFNFAEARNILTESIAKLTASISFQQNNDISVGLMEDLVETQSKLSDRDEYIERGGRANIYETVNIQSRQRACYTKSSALCSAGPAKKSAMNYQIKSSSAYQQAANFSKLI